MRIEWNGETAQVIIRRLEEVERVLNECVRRAQAIRSDLDEANPDGDNRRMNAIINRYEMTVARLRRSVDDAETLANAAKHAAVCFDEAEDRVRRLMENAEGGKNAPDSGLRSGSGSAIGFVPGTVRPGLPIHGSGSAEGTVRPEFTITTHVDWEVPTPAPMPVVTPRLNIIAPPAWIFDLLK